ncbi:hypothetical protein TPY_0418 [Sulfobacillus acidophilus TPY]|uniref:Uncharacterized protein n=1 Tax=Sulfobacillus acidophilus (strain ATCC 700253 / DSM 10332 / NAL) TaxID=679936 RepID=G8TY43_SULAD|nr:hypothetical protein TPY_0418 [Sulfobacillus acidophilus TPY]AEW03950.1 hypothetical protein Sulac_0382 [Sulfobacillus acidophilus DSM 10332]
MESVHIRLPELLIRQIDRVAQERSKERSVVVRELLATALDLEGITHTVDRAVRESLARQDWSPTRKQIAELGASLTYAVLLGLGRPSDQIATVVRQVRSALEEG